MADQQLKPRLILFALIFALGIPIGLALDRLPVVVQDRWVLKPVDFDAVANWATDDHAAALEAFLISCKAIERQPDNRPMGKLAAAGTIADWKPLCRQALTASPNDAREFFEANFAVHAVKPPPGKNGLFTGYFEPLLTGSRSPSALYSIPIYSRPADLVEVDLGEFRDDLAGRRIAGAVKNGRLEPYASRADINDGALQGRAQEILWTDDLVGLFFLQIQGSGRVLLDDGTTVRIGYHGPNGHPYTSLGRLMIQRNILNRDEVSMQSIRQWLQDNPELGEALMEENRSYTFFRLLDGPGPIGAQGVPLTAGRSLAVDRQVVPLGVPVWVSTLVPDLDAPSEDEEAFERLMVAQDTGGAIRGAVRGDIFFGFGQAAEVRAGHMASPGRYYLLLPKGVRTEGRVAAR